MSIESIFDPRVIGERSYKEFYPELKRIPEFKPLTNRMLKVVWYYSNSTSPFVKQGLSNYERIIKAIESSDPNGDKISKADRHRLISMEFTDEFISACNRMSSMNFSARNEANSMLGNFMNNFSEISKLKPKDFVDSKGIIDYEKYARTAGTIMGNLTNLIKMAEEGFGVAKETSVIEEESLISKYHESRKE